MIEIVKSFGNLRALDGISMDVEERKISILIGPNGSGKTTLINTISGLFKPDLGKVFLEERDITGLPPWKLYQMGIARTFQIPQLFWKLTVLENLLIAEKNNPGENFFGSLLKRLWARKEEQAIEKASRRTLADSLLKVDHVFAGYGKLQILSDVSLEASPNEITVIVGPNGSGKSTLLKTIAGLTKVYSGQITFANNGRTLDLTRLPSHEIARSGIVYLPQTKSTFTQLTVAENLKMAGYTVRERELETRLENALVMFPKLASHLDMKVSSLSGGERQMVAMSM